jgi:hypothetical protein
MYPMMAPGMISARVEELRREVEAWGRSPRRATPGLRLRLRAGLGVRLVRLVWLGCRLLREPVRIQRVEVG